jgi:hypothetical protein
MQIPTLVKKAALAAINPRIISCKREYLFLLSHMRSRSSVMSHVLGSNSNICGHSELHRSYLNYVDLWRMNVNAYYHLPYKVLSKYFFDKILHNQYVISQNILNNLGLKIIILLREPEGTIKSIINMGQTTGLGLKTPEEALSYYCSRLLVLEQYAKRIKKNYFFVESDELIFSTEKVLTGVTKWLDLEEPLQETYSIFGNTGEYGHGDPLGTIKSGFIQKTGEYTHIQISPEILKKGISAYSRCKSSLLEGSQVVTIELSAEHD